MFRMLKWPIGRSGRGTMFLWFVLGSIGFSAIRFFAFRQIDIGMTLFSFQSVTIRYSTAPLWYIALGTAFDLALLVVVIARLHDIGKPGWCLLGFVALAALATLPGLGFLAIIGLVLWFALMFWPGTFGPNAYGPHPLGWESREQYERQMRELREHVPPGKA